MHKPKLELFHWIASGLTFFVAAAVYLYINANSFLISGLESYFKVPIEIASLQLAPHWIIIDALLVGNPPPIHTPHFAMKLRKGTLQAPLSTYFATDVHIHEIILHDLHLSLVYTDPNNEVGNWSIIGSKVVSSDEDSEKPGSLTIDRLILRGFSVTLKNYGEDRKDLPPIEHDIVIDNISSKRGVLMEQISTVVINEMMSQLGLLYGIANMFSSATQVPLDVTHEIAVE